MTMRDCPDGAMRDLLPLYTSGTLAAGDQRRVGAHLERCADCAAEVELIRAVSRAYAAKPVNVATIVSKLPARRAIRSAAVPFHRQPLWRVAASLTVFIAGTATVLVVRGRAPETAASRVAAIPATRSGEALRAETTRAAAPGVVRTTSSGILALSAELADLTDAQLQSLLGSLDGLDSRPTAEPTTIVTPIIQERPQTPGRSNQ